VSLLRKEGIDGIIIGSTVLGLALKKREFEDDIDLFTTSLSPLVDEERIREIASRNGWSVGYTELGTPSITLNVDGSDIRVDLYENIMDFYIPQQALDVCRRSLAIEGTEIKFVALECWLVFKARRGAQSDINALTEVKRLEDDRVVKLDLNLMKRVIELYEEDAHYILDRLRACGFRI